MKKILKIYALQCYIIDYAEVSHLSCPETLYKTKLVLGLPSRLCTPDTCVLMTLRKMTMIWGIALGPPESEGEEVEKIS